MGEVVADATHTAWNELRYRCLHILYAMLVT